MTDKVLLCNMGFLHVKVATIQTFDQVGNSGNIARTFYDPSRKATLEKYNWNFARRRKPLNLLALETVPAGWQFRYALPSDCIIMRELEHPMGPRPLDPYPFEIELSNDGKTKTLITNVENAIGVYTADIENPNLFSAGFCDAFSWRFGAYAAVPGGASADHERRCFNWWTFLLSDAASAVANERQDDHEPDGLIVRSRN